MDDLAAELRGLSVYEAKRKISLLGHRVGELNYVESPVRRLTVLAAKSRPVSGSEIAAVDLTLSGTNPIKYLPGIYQGNEFLTRFLWVFQHLAYDTTAILDNLHRYFTPVDAPREFVEWIARWFGLNLDHLGADDASVILLQNAVPLYRWRGTARGLKALLKILTGVEPEIYENQMPYGPYVISGTDVTAHVLDPLTAKCSFTVHFPVEEQSFSTSLRAQVSQVLKSEKPAHAQCFVTYKAPDREPRKTMVVTDSSQLPGLDGMML